MKRYVVKQRKNGDWLALDAGFDGGERAKRAARCWGLSGNAWLLVAEGEDGFFHGELAGLYRHWKKG